MKQIIVAGFIVASLFLSVLPVSAHVVVRPAEVGVGKFQTFTVGVPNEKNNPTTAVRVVIPEGLKHVTPNVKPGWTISAKKTGEGDAATVSEISWTGGSIPEGQRDEFLFSAQVPTSETTISWKAYQSYRDGTVVAWDQQAESAPHDDTKNEHVGPASTTKIINDLAVTAKGDEHGYKAGKKNYTDKVSLLFSTASIILSLYVLTLQLKKTK